MLLLLMCRHGLRASKTVRVGRQNLNLGRARVWIRRLENGLSIEPSIAVNELGAFKGYLHTLHGALPWLFVPERGQPMNRRQHSGQQLQHMGAPEDVARHAGVGSRTIAWHGLARRVVGGVQDDRPGCRNELLQKDLEIERPPPIRGRKRDRGDGAARCHEPPRYWASRVRSRRYGRPERRGVARRGPTLASPIA